MAGDGRGKGRGVPVGLLLAVAAGVVGVAVGPGLRPAAGPAAAWRERDAGPSLVREAEMQRRALRRRLEAMAPEERARTRELMKEFGLEE